MGVSPSSCLEKGAASLGMCESQNKIMGQKERNGERREDNVVIIRRAEMDEDTGRMNMKAADREMSTKGGREKLCSKEDDDVFPVMIF